jgi:hypothetical protein
MGGDALENELLDAGFTDETKSALGEVAKATMEQAAGAAAGAKGEVVLVHQDSS